MNSEHEKQREKSGAFYAGQWTESCPDGANANIEHNRALRELLPTFIDRDDFALLDIGCGRGRVARIVKDAFPRVRVFGIDIAPEQIERAREFVSDGVFQVANEINLPFEDASFDYATCRMSIHHYPDMQGHLREVARVLKPGGCYLIIDAVPIAGEQDEWLNEVFLAREREGKGDGHLKFYNIEEYQRFFLEAGLIPERQEALSNTIIRILEGDQQLLIYRNMLRAPESFRTSIRFAAEGNQYRYDIPACIVSARKPCDRGATNAPK